MKTRTLCTLAMLLCLMVLALGLAACGGGGSEPAGEGQTITTDPFGRFDETVDVTQTRILAGWMGFDDGENEDYNWWTRTYYDHLNVRLTNLFTADGWGEPFDMAINLAFATGELPDVMPLYTSLAVRAIEGGLVMDITELFETHASPQVKSILSMDPRALEAWSVDGRIMGLSSPLDTPGFPFFWIPQSMLNEFNGGVIPTTFEEFNRLAHWVAEYTGGYAIALDNQLRQLDYFVSMVGGTNHWTQQGSELAPGRIQPEMRAAWALLAEWYEAGILARDFAVRTDDDVEADFINRRMGIMVGGSHMPNSAAGRNYMLMHPDDDLVAIPMMTLSGAPMNAISSGGYNDVIMISANASYETAVAIMRMFNLGTAISNDSDRPDWVTDHHFNTTPGGNMGWWNRMATGGGFLYDRRPEYDGIVMALNAMQTPGGGDALRAARAFRALENYERITDWINYGTAAEHWEGNWAMWNMALGSAATPTEIEMFHQGRSSFSPRWGVETATEATNSANLAARYLEFATIAIMNNDVDSQFDQWVDFFMNNGGTQIIAEVNEWWAEHR